MTILLKWPGGNDDAGVEGAGRLASLKRRRSGWEDVEEVQDELLLLVQHLAHDSLLPLQSLFTRLGLDLV
jgi:hypothetical protein